MEGCGASCQSVRKAIRQGPLPRALTAHLYDTLCHVHVACAPHCMRCHAALMTFWSRLEQCLMLEFNLTCMDSRVIPPMGEISVFRMTALIGLVYILQIIYLNI